MRMVVLTLSVLVCSSSAQADSWANKIFGGSPNVPIVHDFGVVAKGAQLQTTLKMTNIYKVPLDVTHIRVSCGCVEAKESLKQIPPNGTADLVIKMDATRFTGAKTVNIFVTFGPQFVSTANLIVSANARGDIVLNPGEIDFGTAQRGASISRSIEIECAGKKDWKVVEIQKGQKAPFDLKAEVLPPRQINGAPVIGYRLTATLKPGADMGAFRETVDLKTNDPAQPVVSFFVSGNIGARVTVAPNPIQVAGLRLGARTTAKVVVTANEPFQIVGVQGAGADVAVTLPTRAAPTHVLDVTVSPTAPGMLNRELILQTSMGGETVRVIVQGMVNP